MKIKKTNRFKYMKEARMLLDNGGLSLFLVAVVFSLAKEYLLVPALSFIWRMSLMTTPDGYISNANILATITKSPWMVLIGLFNVGLFLAFNIWQVAATFIGIAYAYEGKVVKVRDMLFLSAAEIKKFASAKNWMIVFYIAIILPITNIFQASEMMGAFVIPEYIQDFIDSKIVLSITKNLIGIAALIFTLLWIYVLPSFFLKRNDFKKAAKESIKYTKKENIKNMFSILIYSFLESVRLILLPYLVILGVCAIGLAFVSKMPYAVGLYEEMVLGTANELIDNTCGVMLYLSTICYVVVKYYGKCKEDNTFSEVSLTELSGESKWKIKGKTVRWVTVAVLSVSLLLIYLIVVIGSKFEPEILEDILNDPVVVAHKGYSSKAPENTMDAFELADETDNADFIELDVWSTKDGVPVVVHNETIEAATGQDGNVYDYTYEELCKLPAPYSMNLDDYPDARIPSLEEVLSEYADSTPILIEIKGYKKDEQLPAKIVALMEKYNCTETSMIHSGDYESLKAVKLCNKDIKCGLIQAVVTGNSYDLPYADFLSVEHSFVTNNMVEQLHDRGKKIYVWTVNYDETVSALKTMDIDGIITDYPDKVGEAMEVNSRMLDLVKNRVSLEIYETNDSEQETKTDSDDY